MIDERREEYRPSGRLDRLEQLCGQNAIQISNLIKAVEKIENWREMHLDEAKSIETNVAIQQQIISSINVNLTELRNTMKTMMEQYFADKNRFQGGWWILVTLGGFFTGTLSFLGLLLKILGVL